MIIAERIVQLDEETHWREVQRLQAQVAMERELVSQVEHCTCYPAPVEQRSRIQVTRHLFSQVYCTCKD